MPVTTTSLAMSLRPTSSDFVISASRTASLFVPHPTRHDFAHCSVTGRIDHGWNPYVTPAT